MRLTVLIIGVSCFVLLAKAHESTKHSLTLVDQSEATTTLAKLNDAVTELVIARTQGETDLVLLDVQQKVEKLQTSKESLSTQTEVKLKTLNSNRELNLTKIESDLKSLKTTKQLQLTKLNEELAELIVTQEKLKQLTLELPLKLDTHKIFDAMDSDNNGKLSHQEFKDGTKLPDGNDQFDVMDTSDDGSLSPEEFAEGLESKPSTAAPKDD